MANRDLSWLSFNYRVLLEARDPSVPLYDRIKFLSIFSSNLDEFFRVRVAHWQNLHLIEKKRLRTTLRENPEVILRRIHQIVESQLKEYGKLFREIIYKQLAAAGVQIYRNEKVLSSHRDAVRNYFRSKVLTYLQPVILNAGKSKTLFLKNKELYFALSLKRKLGKDKMYYAVLNIPSQDLPRFIQLPDIKGRKYFMFLDDVIRANLQFVFPGYEVLECAGIKLNRDADLQIDDEFTGDLADKIRKHLARRNVGNPSRFLFDESASKELISYFCDRYSISEMEAVPGGRYHNLNDFMSLPNPAYPRLSYPENRPLRIPAIDDAHSIFEILDRQDVLLHFPYQSYDYVLRFFNEAAIDPKVREIKITLYRIASDSFIANALISAAQNGKKVTVFVELKARFDEENNLLWAEKMKQAGIRIIYSIPGLKVHAKVSVVIRKSKGKKVKYGYFGTGNFNEKTADIYADHTLLTSHEAMTIELNFVFNHLCNHPDPPLFNHLLVSQFNMKERLLGMIKREMEIVKKGGKGHVVLKINNLEEPQMIKALYKAANGGVKIDLIVRSVCCLLPISENIRIIRLVDRYLEHARVFWFGNNGSPEVFLGSADWMSRNLHRRIEVDFPLHDPALKEEVETELMLQLEDNTKAYYIKSETQQLKKNEPKKKKVRAQQEYYQWLKSRCR